jgi:hypothetical protein
MRILLLKYKQRISNIDYNQEEEVEASNLDVRIKELKSFSNRNYHSFRL